MLRFVGQIYSSRGVYVSPGQSIKWADFGLRAYIESVEFFDIIIYLFG